VAIYEKGVLRPLQPLRLPERTRVQIQITVPPSEGDGERQRVLQALLEAGVIQPRPDVESVGSVPDEQLAAAARELAAAGPLSELIIAAREDE